MPSLALKNRRRSQDSFGQSCFLLDMKEAYEGIANTSEILILHNEYPLENAGWAGCLQSENPVVVEAIKKLNG